MKDNLNYIYYLVFLILLSQGLWGLRFCTTDKDCGKLEFCDHGICSLKKGKCYDNFDCQPWEFCDKYNNCVVNRNEGMCSNNLDCENGVCDSLIHKCVPLANAERDVVIIFDNSGSMAGVKFEKAKKAALSAIDALENSSRIALILFSGQCGVINYGFINADRVRNEINKTAPKEGTPIGNSLISAYNLLNENSTSNLKFILLFTDGEEMCGMDPCGIVRKFNKDTNVPIYTIGYIVDEKAEDQLRCIAKVSNGEYFKAPTEEEISEVINEAALKIIGSKCVEESDCGPGLICLNERCTTPILHLVFVPVNWNKERSGFLNAVKSQSSFLISTLPSLSNCTNKIKISTINENLNLNHPSFIDTDAQMDNDIDTLINFTNRRFRYYYDFVFGVVPSEYFKDSTTRGYTFTGSKGAIISEKGEIIAAHELGHRFGLKDEYCDCGEKCGSRAFPNPLDKKYGCDPSVPLSKGGCCYEPEWYEIYLSWLSGKQLYQPYKNCYKICEGNMNEKGGRSIMSYLSAPGPRYHDEPSLNYLSSILRCD